MRRKARYSLSGCSLREKRLASEVENVASRAGRTVEPAKSVKPATHSATKRLNPAVPLPAAALAPRITFLGEAYRKIRASSPDQLAQRLQRIGLGRRLVVTPPQHPRKTHRDAAAMTRRRTDRLEAKLEDLHRFHRPHRAVPLAGVPPDPLIELLDLGVRQARVGLGHRN